MFVLHFLNYVQIFNFWATYHLSDTVSLLTNLGNELLHINHTILVGVCFIQELVNLCICHLVTSFNSSEHFCQFFFIKNSISISINHFKCSLQLISLFLCQLWLLHRLSDLFFWLTLNRGLGDWLAVINQSSYFECRLHFYLCLKIIITFLKFRNFS